MSDYFHSLMSRRRALSLLSATALVPLASSDSIQNTAPPAARSKMGDLIHYSSLQDVARLIAARAVSSVELTRHMLDRIATVDAALKSYATVMADSALADAKAADHDIQAGTYRGPLHGVPIAVKDLCYTKGVRTMSGTPVLKDFIPDADSTVVVKLREAGAVMLGKLNLTEGAMTGYHPSFDVPLNPWNRDRWPGASSSGSGVAAAAGLCFAAIGTDTGGSIRFPSSANGIVGLKPTYGRVSRFGVQGLADSLDHVGPMARRVADVAIMFDAIAGRDPNDPTSLDAPAAATFKALGGGVRGLRVGIDREYALKGIDNGQAAAIEAALKVLTGLGVRLVDVRMPDLKSIGDTWIALCASEAAAAHRANYPARADQYGPYFRTIMAMGARTTPEQLDQARKAREAFAAQFVNVLESVDAMAGPSGGDPAWPVTRTLQTGPLADLHKAWGSSAPRATDFTFPADLAGTPAICLPSGFSPDGLPYSIQFVGRRLTESTLCGIAHAYEQATGWHTRHPAV